LVGVNCTSAPLCVRLALIVWLAVKVCAVLSFATLADSRASSSVPALILVAFRPVTLAPLPLKPEAVIVPAEKLPLASRLTRAPGVLASVALLAAAAPLATLLALRPPTEATTVAPCVPVTSPASEPLKLVALVAVVALVAFVAVSAAAALKLRMAYGVAVSGWRGLSVVKLPPPAGRTLISRKRAAPGKAAAPKSNSTEKTPPVTVTPVTVTVLGEPCSAPPVNWS
jgi:hypothetical protein